MGINSTVMAKVRNESKLRQFAVVGAQVRIRELQSEIDRITKQFGRRTLSSGTSGTEIPFPKRTAAAGKKPRMSAAARRRISEAQKARWARQKARSRVRTPQVVEYFRVPDV